MKKLLMIAAISGFITGTNAAFAGTKCGDDKGKKCSKECCKKGAKEGKECCKKNEGEKKSCCKKDAKTSETKTSGATNQNNSTETK